TCMGAMAERTAPIWISNDLGLLPSHAFGTALPRQSRHCSPSGSNTGRGRQRKTCMMKQVRLVEMLRLAILAVALGLCDRNTLAGFGRDVQAAGRAVTNSAEQIAGTPSPQAAAAQ